MLKSLEALRMRDAMLAQSPSEETCLKMSSDKLTAIDKHNWQNELFNDRNGSENGNKLKTYRTFKIYFTPEQDVITTVF